jgi:predicted  nucleic acid-binding Zn-ribbon protein
MSCIELPVTYSFDYSNFSKPELELKAQTTLSNFLGFVRQTFDGLLEIGRSLQDFYFDCLAFCSNGKKVFSEWLASPDFGASHYIASSAMEISAWFEKLPARSQRLIRQNVQNWSVSALRQLTKVSHDLVKELVQSGKKTAAQVKQERGSERAREGGNKQAFPSEDANQISSSIPELVPGMRIVVKEENTGWNGSSGIIMSKRQDDFWVLLDHTIAQGMEVKHLLKPHQIELETQQPVQKPISQELFTAAQVEQKITDAISSISFANAQHNREKAESEQGRFVEIRDAALQAAKREIQAAQEHARAIAQKNQDLLEQLASKDLEMRSLNALQTKNQQLEKRVAELEKALENSSANNWGNTFSNQAAKVVNSELEKTIEPLMSEVDRLNNVLSQKEQEIVRLQMSSGQESDAVLAEFGEIGERFGWQGWSSRGYRAASGMFCTGINAIAQFIADLKSSSPTYQQQEIAF